jgi:hypothetical protein
LLGYRALYTVHAHGESRSGGPGVEPWGAVALERRRDPWSVVRTGPELMGRHTDRDPDQFWRVLAMANTDAASAAASRSSQETT